MTLLLEKAFTQAQKLPDHDQDVIASLILEEMLAERAWDESFAKSADQLAQLADEALAEHKRGETRPLKFD